MVKNKFKKSEIKIKDLKEKQPIQNMIVEVIEKQEEREYNKQRVTSVKIKDDTGEARLDLWDNDIDEVNVGDLIIIKKGFSKGEYEGVFDLTKGKYGEIEIL